VIEGAMNRVASDADIESQLAPTLEKGDIVIRDNLAVRRSAKAAQCLKEKGAWFLLLPPSSPDPNPIGPSTRSG
jgi:transposase